MPMSHSMDKVPPILFRKIFRAACEPKSVPKFEAPRPIVSLRQLNRWEEKKYDTQQDVQTEHESSQLQANRPSQKEKNLFTKTRCVQNKCAGVIKDRTKCLSINNGQYSILIKPLADKLSQDAIPCSDYLLTQNSSQTENKWQLFESANRKRKSIWMKSSDKQNMKSSKSSMGITRILISKCMAHQTQRRKGPISGIDTFHITFEAEEALTACCT